MTDQNLGDQGAGSSQGQTAPNPEEGSGGQASASQSLSHDTGGDGGKAPSKLDVLMEFVPEEDRQYIKTEEDFKKYQAHMRDKTLTMYEIERRAKLNKESSRPSPAQTEDPLVAIEGILVEENKRDAQKVREGELTADQAFARSQMRSADMARRMAQADMDSRDKVRDEKQGKLLEFERTSALPRSIRAQIAFLIDQQGWPVEAAERYGRDMVDSLKSEGFREPDRLEERGGDTGTNRYARSFVEPPGGGASGALYGNDEAVKEMDKAIANLKPGQSFADLPWGDYLKKKQAK